MEKNLNLPNIEIVKPLLIDISNGLNNVFADDPVVGLYLGGSLAIGGFDEAKSDLDFLVVLTRDITSEEVNKLRIMHDTIKGSHKNRLYDNYEGVYLTQKQVLSPNSANMYAPHLGSEGHFDVENHGPEIIIDLWKIRKSGFVVYGQSPTELIGDITDDEMIQAKIDLFRSWWLPKLEHKEPMDSEYQAYAVLTMTRILYSLANHNEVSKKESASWCIDHYDKHADIIRDALSWEPGIELNNIERVYDLISLVNEQVANYTS